MTHSIGVLRVLILSLFSVVSAEDATVAFQTTSSTKQDNKNSAISTLLQSTAEVQDAPDFSLASEEKVEEIPEATESVPTSLLPTPMSNATSTATTSIQTGLYAILTHMHTEISVRVDVTTAEPTLDQPVLLDSRNNVDLTPSTTMREFTYPIMPTGKGVGSFKEVSLSGRPFSQATREGRSFNNFQTEASVTNGAFHCGPLFILTAAMNWFITV